MDKVLGIFRNGRGDTITVLGKEDIIYKGVHIYRNERNHITIGGRCECVAPNASIKGGMMTVDEFERMGTLDMHR